MPKPPALRDDHIYGDYLPTVERLNYFLEQADVGKRVTIATLKMRAADQDMAGMNVITLMIAVLALALTLLTRLGQGTPRSPFDVASAEGILFCLLVFSAVTIALDRRFAGNRRRAVFWLEMFQVDQKELDELEARRALMEKG